jgi:hypothetical protein
MSDTRAAYPAASGHLVLYHGAHHEDVPSIVASGLRPSGTGSGWTLTDSHDGAAIHAEKRDWTAPRVVEFHVPRDHARDYLGEPSAATEGTVYALRRHLPAEWMHQVHEVPPTWAHQAHRQASAVGEQDTRVGAHPAGQAATQGAAVAAEARRVATGAGLTAGQAFTGQVGARCPADHAARPAGTTTSPATQIRPRRPR